MAIYYDRTHLICDLISLTRITYLTHRATRLAMFTSEFYIYVIATEITIPEFFRAGF